MDFEKLCKMQHDQIVQQEREIGRLQNRIDELSAELAGSERSNRRYRSEIRVMGKRVKAAENGLLEV